MPPRKRKQMSEGVPAGREETGESTQTKRRRFKRITQTREAGLGPIYRMFQRTVGTLTAKINELNEEMKNTKQSLTTYTEGRSTDYVIPNCNQQSLENNREENFTHSEAQ